MRIVIMLAVLVVLGITERLFRASLTGLLQTRLEEVKGGLIGRTLIKFFLPYTICLASLFYWYELPL